jgi:hypothetical protein
MTEEEEDYEGEDKEQKEEEEEEREEGGTTKSLGNMIKSVMQAGRRVSVASVVSEGVEH